MHAFFEIWFSNKKIQSGLKFGHSLKSHQSLFEYARRHGWFFFETFKVNRIVFRWVIMARQVVPRSVQGNRFWWLRDHGCQLPFNPEEPKKQKTCYDHFLFVRMITVRVGQIHSKTHCHLSSKWDLKRQHSSFKYFISVFQ